MEHTIGVSIYKGHQKDSSNILSISCAGGRSYEYDGYISLEARKLINDIVYSYKHCIWSLVVYSDNIYIDLSSFININGVKLMDKGGIESQYIVSNLMVALEKLYLYNSEYNMDYLPPYLDKIVIQYSININNDLMNIPSSIKHITIIYNNCMPYMYKWYSTYKDNKYTNIPYVTEIGFSCI
jgi:hypothetical protein